MESGSDDEIINNGGRSPLQLNAKYQPHIELVGAWNMDDNAKSQITDSAKSAFEKFKYDKSKIVNTIRKELCEKLGGGWICVTSGHEFVTNDVNPTESRESVIKFYVDYKYYLLICRIF
ncbi:dynein light chain type 1 domain-containing protein [Ditylenchus destructor]|nr:dynein light chain type 1 domain-containing protein [Ditylenchus destructor]